MLVLGGGEDGGTETEGGRGAVPFGGRRSEMVSRPVVSQGLAGDSTVVWDKHKFLKRGPPRYFKHSNFSGFIRQLNTYAECDPLGASSYSVIVPTDNPRGKEARILGTPLATFAQELRFNLTHLLGFQRGKKHLLKNIKRRRKFSNHRKPWSGTVTSDYPKAGKEAELEMHKMDQEAMKDEILKLREERENLRRVINQVAERIRYVKCRNRQMFLFLSKAAKSPNFVQHLMKKRWQKSEWITIFKARMLIT
ncbi:hypothetical protein NL676_033525 [Syzygium grande]|nr:hypothetical protein NL676_033525 [Syzygium grande]